MAVGRRFFLPLLLLALPTVAFLGVGTLWGLQSERTRMEERARTSTRETLAIATGLIRDALDRRSSRVAAAGAELLGGNGRPTLELSEEDRGLLVVFDSEGERLMPAAGRTLSMEQLLDRSRRRDDVELAFGLMSRGETAAASALLKGAGSEDATAAALLTFLGARENLDAGRKEAALPALAALVAEPEGNLTSAQRFFAFEALLVDACARRDEERARKVAGHASREFLPQVTIDTDLAAHFIATFAARASDFLADLGGELRRALRARLEVMARVALLPSGVPGQVGDLDEQGEGRIPFSRRFAAVRRVRDAGGKPLGTVLVLPPPTPGVAAAAGPLSALRSQGYEVALQGNDGRSAPGAVAVALGDFAPDLQLVATPGGGSQPFPWRTLVTVGFLLACFLLVGAGAWITWRSLVREQKLLSARSSFLATVSHQIKTPVANLRLFAETLASGRVTDSKDRERMEGILQSEAVKLGDYLERVLSVTRLDEEADAGTWDTTTIELSGLLDSLTVRWNEAALVRGVRLHVAASGPLPVIRGDERALADALHNVVDNALQHTRPGGGVRIEAGCDDACVRIRVRDQGPGIDPNLREKIFERFVRGSGAQERAGQGTGLGLAIARVGAGRAGGTIAVEETGPDGTTMTLTLPT